MKIYTIATEARECYGHGDYRNEKKICREIEFGNENFPPAFVAREDAEKYIKELRWKSGEVVVEMELHGLLNS